LTWPQDTLTTIQRLNTVRRDLDDRYVGRDQAARLMILASVCNEHLLLLGPPGTAKTSLVDRYCQWIGARRFRYLLSRFTEPTELFGPLDVVKFQEGVYEVVTTGMLPEAEIAFLDEVFQGSSAILNALLTLLNERRFDNGAEPVRTPLISLFGASAELPEDPALRPFSDRFLLRLYVEPVDDARLGDLLDRGWEHESEALAGGAEPVADQLITPEELAALTHQLYRVVLTKVKPVYRELLRELRAQHVELSDRRAVRGLKLVAGACLLRGADTAETADLWPLAHVWSAVADADLVRRAVAERTAEDPLASAPPARSAVEIVAAAQYEAGQAVAPGFALTEGAVTASLQELSRLRRELILGHPGDETAIKQLDRHIDEVARLYETIR
jgi:MoxR-like ATPase